MITTTLGSCAEVTGSTLHSVDSESEVSGVSTDSRKIAPGELFVCIEGERFDGATFAKDAIARGAVAALSSKQIPGVPLVLAPGGAIAALQSLARWNRDKCPDITVVGITGSAGKTLTKDFIAQVLNTKGRVVATKRSENNEIGLPMTVLEADLDTRFLVLEMGARHAGDIENLVAIARPQISVVTNVGLAHVEIFGSIEDTQRAKSEIVQRLDSDCYAVLNADDERVMAMKSVTKAQVLTFGQGSNADVRFENVSIDPAGSTTFDLSTSTTKRVPVKLDLAGRYLASNAAAAAAVGLVCGVELSDSAKALSEGSSPSPHRARVKEAKGFTVIDDSYNANPEAMFAALQMLKDVAGVRRKVAVIGDMRELGSESARQHELVGSMLSQFQVSVLIAVGEAARGYVSGSSDDVVCSWVPDAAGAIEILQSTLEPDDVVLVKASRAIGLDEVVERLIA